MIQATRRLAIHIEVHMCKDTSTLSMSVTINSFSPYIFIDKQLTKSNVMHSPFNALMQCLLL